jgi:hypothetical protein
MDWTDQDHGNKDTSLALNRAGEPVFIGDASSGKHGYFCIGCKEEMVAVKPRRKQRPYFRHYATEVSPRKKCTYSDLSERYRIAKESLITKKEIKVPAIYKYPNDQPDGAPYKVSSAKYIKAFSVAAERYFYEDNNQNIQWGDERNVPQLKFLVKAHVVFLDQNDNPILLILFVENHSLSQNEKVNLHNLGIDAVQVKIPRASPESIINIFSTTENTKWLYSIEYETTTYVRTTSAPSGEIQYVDEFQRKFLGENFYCRRSQITRLIRQVTIYFGSPSFTEIEQRLKGEISRLEQLANEEQTKFFEFQERETSSLQEEYSRQESEITSRREALLGAEKRIARISEDLEKRYERKAGELDIQRREFDARIKQELGEETIGGSSIATRKIEIEGNIRSIEETIKNEEASLSQLQRETDAIPEKFTEEHRTAVETIQNRNTSGNSELSNGLRAILDCRGIIHDIQKKQRTYNRYRRLYESLKSGAFKNWND